eukprot:COSAG04_NODE_18289_length_446_cov_1.011527_2_plen_61_part_01
MPAAPLTQGFVVRRNTLSRTQPCDFAPSLELFGPNQSRFYWNFDSSPHCAKCRSEANAEGQ